MERVLIVTQLFFSFIIGIYFLDLLISKKKNKTVLSKDSTREMLRLLQMRNIKLTEPLSEKSRPKNFDEIIGQEKGIKGLKAAICGPNPQHVIIYGPPGVGKTAAARLVLDKAIKDSKSPFTNNGRFIEIDATTLRFDDRGIADPLIGSVHDPIYQGAGSLGMAGIPQPKEGAVTKANGGILFIDEIGELHPIELNKLLKVLEDRKVFLDSAYYSKDDENIPNYIKEIFDNGFPADFRLIGATTKRPEEISDALRSRCVEIYFKSLEEDEIEEIVKRATLKIKLNIDERCIKLISRYAENGREAVNMVQLASSIVLSEERERVLLEDVEWVIENGRFSPKAINLINKEPEVGLINGLAVTGINQGRLIKIQAVCKKIRDKKGEIIITGVAEKEEIKNGNSTIIRKSSMMESALNVLTYLNNYCNIDTSSYNIHINFQGGALVDGPSAGASIATAIYSAINGIKINNKIGITGEISVTGKICEVGGVSEKIKGAIKAGCSHIIIPKGNFQESYKKISEIKIIPVETIEEVINIARINEITLENESQTLTARGK